MSPGHWRVRRHLQREVGSPDLAVCCVTGRGRRIRLGHIARSSGRPRMPSPGYPLSWRQLSWAVYPLAAHHRAQVPRLALASRRPRPGRTRSDQPTGSMFHRAGPVRPDVPSSRLHEGSCRVPELTDRPLSRRRQAAAANRRHREPPPQRTAGIRHRSPLRSAPLRSDGGRGPDCRFPRQRHAVANEFLNGYPVPSSYRHRTVFTDTSCNLECEISLPVWTMNQALSLKGMSLPPSYRSCRASARWLRAG